MKSRLTVLAGFVLAAVAYTGIEAGAQRRPAVPPAPAPAAVPSPIQVRTTLSRSAAWLGDEVTYSVELRCAPTFDIVLDDLSRERIRVDGGELLRSDSSSEEQGGVIVHRLRYTLASYRVDTSELRIRAIPVRYFARGTGLAEGTPAGEVTVPAALVPIRSTLPNGGTVPAVRQPETLRPVPLTVWFAGTVGLLMIAIAIVPVAMAGLDIAGRVRRSWAGRNEWRARRRQRLSMEQLKAATPESDGARVEAFAQLDALVRDRLNLPASVNPQALTPAEVRRSMEQRSPSSSFPHHDLEALLIACESARYSADPPSAAEWEGALQDAQQVLAAARR